MSALQNSADLVQQVRQALKQFHDLAYLGSCPLATWSAARRRLPRDGPLPDHVTLGRAVQALLDEAIEALKPATTPNPSLPPWRAYRLLDLTFRQGESASHIYNHLLHLSRTQYYRELDKAIAAVAGLLQDWEWAARMQPDAGGNGDTTPNWADTLPPPTYTCLFGADEPLAAVLAALRDPAGRWLVVVDGLGGVGKTALAREAAVQALQGGAFAGLVWQTAQRQSFNWGAIEVNGEPALTVERLLDGIALQAGLPCPLHWPTEEKQRALRAALRRDAYLLVVDNLETAEDYRAIAQELWALTNPSKALITSRRRLDRYDPVAPVHLRALDQAATSAFARHHAAERGVEAVQGADEATMQRFYQATGGNPLAVKLVIGQAASRPLDQVLDHLVQARGDADPLYRFIYWASWHLLSPPARQLLLTMPHLAVSGGPWDALATIADLDESQLAAAVDELVTLSLLDVSGAAQKRYSIHPLTHHFVLSELVGGEASNK
jgi:hypothetical protein